MKKNESKFLVSESNSSQFGQQRSGSIVLGQRSIPLWLVGLFFMVLGFTAYFPYLNAGFAGDDIIFINMLEGAIPYDAWKGFWSAEMDVYQAFTSLWWGEAGVSGAFFRPLPSWTLTLLYQLFGRNAVPYHLTLVLLHGLGAFVAFLVLRRLSGFDVPALLASLMFLICEDHGMTVAWITTITDLMCAFSLGLAFISHIVARQEDKRWLLVVSNAFFLLAMMSKETAAIFPVIIIAFEFFYADELDGETVPVTLKNRLRFFLKHLPAWLIPLMVFIVYIILYRTIIPPMRNMMYVDPFNQPFEYLRMVVVNLPVMFAALLTQFLPSLASMISGILPYVAMFGGVLIILLLWALRPYRNERAVWFSLVLFVLGLLPGLAVEASERQLYLPSAYGFFVVAWLIIQIPRFRRRVTPTSPPGVRRVESVWGWYLLFTAVFLPVILLFIYPSMWIPGLQLPEQTMLECLPLVDESKHEHLVYLNTDSSFNTFYLPDIYRYHRGEYIDLRQLSSFNGHVWARQLSDHEIVLKSDAPGWLDNMFARVVRVAPELAPGTVYDNPLFSTEIVTVTPDRRDVLEVRFEFKLHLSDPSLLLLFYDGVEYRVWEPTADWQLLNPVLNPFAF